MRLLGGKRSPIGIDIGSRTIKAAQLMAGRDSLHIVALLQLLRVKPGEAIGSEEVSNLKGVLRRQGFYGHEVVLALPEKQLLRGIFEMPPSVSGAPVAQIARMELSRIHHVEPNSFEMVHWGLPSQGQSRANTQTVAVACPHTAANALLDIFEGCGLTVEALDVRTAAAARACQRLTAPPPAITAILDLGWGSAKLLLICGNTVIYERVLQTELSRLTALLGEEFHIEVPVACQIIDTIGLEGGQCEGDLDEVSLKAIRGFIRNHFRSVIEELKVPLAYATRQYPTKGLNRLLLVGGGAKLEGLVHYLQSTLGLDTVCVTPGALAKGSSDVLTKADHPAMTVAMGLALFCGGASR